MNIVQYIVTGVCGGISLVIIISMWMNHKHDWVIKKLFWTLILCLPVIGWILYGGLYDPPGPGPTKSGLGDSGMQAQ